MVKFTTHECQENVYSYKESNRDGHFHIIVDLKAFPTRPSFRYIVESIFVSQRRLSFISIVTRSASILMDVILRRPLQHTPFLCDVYDLL